jgi:hypothetical protein
VRLLKINHTYKRHFNENINIVNKVLSEYFTQEEIEGVGVVDYKRIKERLVNDNLIMNAKNAAHIICRNGHRDFLKKFLFNFPDMRNFMIIRYFTETATATNQRLFPLCFCNDSRSPEHAANSCNMILHDRDDMKVKFNSIFKRNKFPLQKTLHECLIATFFQIDPNFILADIRKLAELMKKTIFRIITETAEKYKEKMKISQGDCNKYEDLGRND